jgi:calcineurin-like phosphoesterase
LMFRLLFMGDVVGEAGCAAVRALVPTLRRELGLSAVVANGENSAPEGRGITAQSGSALLSVVDFLTLGDHAFDAEGEEEYLDREPRVVRPANLDEDLPGRGWGTFEAGDVRVGVANVQGRLFMQEVPRSPFEAADQAVADLEASGADLVLVDMHAELRARSRPWATTWRVGPKPWPEPKNTQASQLHLHFRALLIACGTRQPLELVWV